MLKKADILLGIVILIIGVVSFIAVEKASFGKGDIVKVTVNKKLYGTYSLWEDRTIKIEKHGHKNNITIKDGKVAMSFSDCKNQDCVKAGTKAHIKENIVCLPNQVFVEIEGKEGGYDGISN